MPATLLVLLHEFSGTTIHYPMLSSYFSCAYHFFPLQDVKGKPSGVGNTYFTSFDSLAAPNTTLGAEHAPDQYSLLIK